MKDNLARKLDKDAPILLRRIRQKPKDPHPTASHMTVVTTGGMQPEMHDQREDAER